MTFFSLLLSPSIYSLELQNTFVIQINIKNTEATIKHGQSRESGNIGYTRRRQTKQRFNRRN
jgi:hypothetical protein